MVTEAAQPRLACRGCGAADTRMVVDLGLQPAADDFPAADSPGPDATWPLQLWICGTCALVQLGPMQALVEEPVRAVESETHRAHARRMADAVLADHPELVGGTVREFASHHGGSWLEALAEHGCHVPDGDEPARLVVDAHALAHDEDVAGSLAERVRVLAPDGLLVLEFHHLLPLVLEGQFDTIRHGHWSYLSLTAVDRLAGEHKLQVVRATTEPVFGGSLRVVLGHVSADREVHPSVAGILAAEQTAGLHDGSGLEDLERRAHVSATQLHAYLTEQRDAGVSVLGYGAPSKAPLLLGLSGVGPELLPFTVDAAPLKHGLAIPGVRVPIRPVADLAAAQPDVVLVLTWDIADEIVRQLESDGKGWGARYVLPLPTPRALDAEVTR